MPTISQYPALSKISKAAKAELALALVTHTAARQMFKVLLENDELPKGMVRR